MKTLLTAFILIISLPSFAGDSTRIKMGGTYTASYGKVYEVYLNKEKRDKRKLFYEVFRNGKVSRQYLRRKVNL